jgi:hypothetical protein
MATGVRTRRIRDEKQARFPAGHAFDGSGLQQFARDLRAHIAILAFHYQSTIKRVGNLFWFRSKHVYLTSTLLLVALEYEQLWRAQSTTPPDEDCISTVDADLSNKRPSIFFVSYLNYFGERKRRLEKFRATYVILRPTFG